MSHGTTVGPLVVAVVVAVVLLSLDWPFVCFDYPLQSYHWQMTASS